MSKTTAPPVANLLAQPLASKPVGLRQTKLQTVADELGRLALNLGAGSKLPTVSDLCAQFGVSVTTLTSVLRELERRGVIRRQHGVGLFVADSVSKQNIVLLCDPG